MSADQREPADDLLEPRAHDDLGSPDHDDHAREGEARWMAHVPGDGARSEPPPRHAVPPAPAGPRPLIERVGMALIAMVVALLFGGVAVAAFSGGEPFLAVMAAIGALLTAWVGAQTLLRG